MANSQASNTHEEQLETTISAQEEQLKTSISTYFGSEITPDKLVWEILPDYFIFKLPHLRIISTCIKTNNAGDRIDFSFFVIDYISFTEIANICQIVDVIIKSSSDKWNQCSYSTKIVAHTSPAKPLIKYTLTTINCSGVKFADRNVVKLKNL